MQKLLKKKLTVVASSTPKKVPRAKWTPREDSAVKLRRGAGQEGIASIAMSLGRSHDSLKSRALILLDPAFTKQSGAGRANTGHKVGWRYVVAKALQQLPDGKGTAPDLYEVIRKMPEVCINRYLDLKHS